MGSDAGEFHGVEVWTESMKVSFQYVDVRPVIRCMCRYCVGGGTFSA